MTMDVIAILDKHSDPAERGHWEEIDGPDSRCGVDHWYRNQVTGREAYANQDQTHWTISIDGDTIFDEEQ